MSSSSSVFTLAGSGIVMGIVHVLTGPDHLSALATLSSNVGPHDAFWYGVRWGIGHSIGLVTVGSILIGWDSVQNPEGNDDGGGGTIDMPVSLQHLFESIVGVFLILLGIHGLISAFNLRREYSLDVLETRGAAMEASRSSRNILRAGGGTNTSISTRTLDMGEEDQQNDGRPGLNRFDSVELGPNVASFDSQSQVSDSSHSSSNRMRPSVVVGYEDPYLDSVLQSQQQQRTMAVEQQELDRMNDHPQHDHAHYFGDHACCSRSFLCLFETICFLPGCRACCLALTEYEIPRRVLAVGIGIVHGVAGPGGVLGVIPAVQLHNWKLAIVYLGTFCATSIVVMGTFAATYGTCSSKVSEGVANLEFRMNVFSSSLSIVVGLLWLVLLSLGKLEDFFP